MIKVGKYLLDDHRVLNAGDHFDSAAAFKACFDVNYAGFWQAVLSMERCKILVNQSECYAALRALTHEILVLCGSEDHIVSASDIDRIRGLLPPHRFTRLDVGQHVLMLTNPESVTAVVRSFMRFTRAAQLYSS